MRINKNSPQHRKMGVIRNLASQIQSPQQLAIYLRQIPSDVMRDEVFKMLKPMLRFKVDGTSYQS